MPLAATMSITSTTEETSLFVDMLAPETALPSLKTANLPKSRQNMVRRLLSMDSDFHRDQDDMLYLRHGQGAHFGSRQRCFQDNVDASSVNGKLCCVQIYNDEVQ